MTRVLRIAGSRKRRAAILGALLAVLAIAFGASAYLTSPGSGSGTATLGAYTGPLNHFDVANPGPQTAGQQFSVSITAKDAANQTITSYTGPQCLTFTGPASSPAPSSTPPTYPVAGACATGRSVTFTNGVASPDVTLFNASTSTNLTVTDVPSSKSGSTGTFTVVDAGAFSLSVSPAGLSQTAGSAFDVTVTALDQYSNLAKSNYTGLQHLDLSGPHSSPAPSGTAPTWTGTNVAETFNASAAVTIPTTLYDAETVGLTAQDDTTNSISGTSADVTVGDAGAASYSITNPGTQTAGIAFSLAITALDQYSNVATSYGGAGGASKTLDFSGAANSPAPSNTAPIYPASATFTNGLGSPAGIQLFNAAATTLTVKDHANNSISGSTGSFNVNPAALDHFVFVLASPQTDGVAFTGTNTLTAKDPYENTVTGFDASANNVTIAANAPLTGAVSGLSGGNKLTSAGDFSGGVANLTSLGIKYTGNTGAGTFTATSATGKTGDSGSVTIDIGGLDHFAFVAASPQTDGVAFTGVNTLTAQDVGDNTITTFDASANNVTITALSPLTGTVSGIHGSNVLNLAGDFSSGVANLTTLGMKYTGNTGTGKFRATSATGKTGDSGNVTINIGGLDHFASVLNSPQTDGVAFTGTNTLTAQDVGNNTITTFDASANNVTIAANSPLTGAVSGLSGGNKLTSAVDFSSGVANLTTLGIKYTGNTGAGTFTATSATGKTGTSGSVTINIGGLDHFAFVAASPQTDGIAFTGTNTLTAQDVGNNTITAFDASANNVTIAANSPLTGAVSGLSGGNKLTSAGDFSSGVANLTTLGIKYVGNTGSGTFTATSATGKTGTSGSVTINIGALDHFALVLNSPQTDGVAFTGTNTLTAQDVGNNTITSFNAATDNVTIAANSPLTGAVSGLSGGNKLTSAGDFSSGVANLTTLGIKYTGNTGTGTFTATSVSGKTGTSGSVTINVGALHHFALVLNSPQTDGIAFTGTNTLTAQDIGNNTITSFNAATDNVTIAANSPLTGAVSGLSGGNKLTSAGDFSSGVANLTTLGIKYTGNTGTGTFTATSVSGKTGTSDSVTINVGALDHFVFVAASPQTSGTPFAGTNTLTAQDVGNNTIPTFDASANNVTITAVSPLTGTVSGIHGSNVLNLAGDFSSGVANLTSLGMTYTGNATTGTFLATSATGKTGTSGSVLINSAVTVFGATDLGNNDAAPTVISAGGVASGPTVTTTTSGRAELIFIHVKGSNQATATTVSSISGPFTGATQVTGATVNYASGDYLFVWTATGNGSGGATSVTFGGGTTAGNVAVDVVQLNAGNTVLTCVSSCTNSGSGTATSATLSVQDASDTEVAFFGAATNKTFSTPTDFSALASAQKGAPANMGSATFASDCTTVQSSVASTLGGSGAWGAVGLEIRASEPPCITAVTLTAVGAANKSAEQNETATMTFSTQLNATTFCSAWTNVGTQQVTNATVTIADSGGNDPMTVTSASCTSGGHFGTVTPGDYTGGGSTTFINSTVTWDPVAKTLTIKLGTLGTNNRSSHNAKPPVYAADAAVTDLNGVAIANSPFTDPTTTGW